jgi:AcrR family transcriptional regulator
MPRLSRAESQAHTRQKLLATARTCFLRDGYAATSLEGIADAAGFSKGAVYSNFRSKDELCLAVLDAIHAERAADLAGAVAGKTKLGDALRSVQSWAETHVGDRAWTSLEVEFGAHAARDPALARELAQRHATLRARVVDVVKGFADAHGIELPLPAGDFAVALLSLMVGLGVQRAVDPSLSLRVLGKAARLLVVDGKGHERAARGAAAPERRARKGRA